MQPQVVDKRDGGPAGEHRGDVHLQLGWLALGGGGQPRRHLLQAADFLFGVLATAGVGETDDHVLALGPHCLALPQHPERLA